MVDSFDSDHIARMEKSSKSIEGYADEIEGKGEVAVVNTLKWMESKNLITPPGKHISVTDPARYHYESSNKGPYLKRSSLEIIEDGYSIACSDPAQVMVDILRTKGEDAWCVDTISDTFLKTGNRQGHMFIEVNLNGEDNLFNPANGEWCKWERDNAGNKFTVWEGIDPLSGENFKETLYFVEKAKSPQEMGYTDLISMQDKLHKYIGRDPSKGLILDDSIWVSGLEKE